MEDFIHLHVHTYYSILDGQSSIKRLVDKATANGMQGMAITDHGNMFGIKEFHDYCISVNKQRKKEGLPPFKPIFGCEMYVAKNGPKEQKNGREDQSGYHLIVLAKNLKGYKNLIKLVSRAWVDGFYQRPRTDRADSSCARHVWQARCRGKSSKATSPVHAKPSNGISASSATTTTSNCNATK